MEQAIQFTLGVSYLIIGLSCLVQVNDWISWMDKIQEDGRRTAVIMGSIALMLSAFIVGAHPIWSGLPLLITLIGVIGMIEGALYLLFPGSLPFLLSFFTQKNTILIRSLSIFSIVLGAVILYIWWEGLAA